MAITLSKKPLKERFPEVLKTPRESLPIHYKIEKYDYDYYAYYKNGKIWNVFKNRYGIALKFSTFDLAKNYIKDACTYFSVSKDHELIEVTETGHIIIDD